MKSKLVYFLLSVPIVLIVAMVVVFLNQDHGIDSTIAEAERISRMENTGSTNTDVTQPVAKTAAQPAEVETVKLRLEGVVQTNDAAQSSALIAVDTFAAVRYRVGDVLDGVDATLQKIESNRSVIVEHQGGRLERLYVAKKERPELTPEEYIEELKKRLQQS